ncbi:MFS transporter [Candidatus Woesearchaeota archaeon]|nr:MFS transporter [Candidatus Woesearchaeota archaeon]
MLFKKDELRHLWVFYLASFIHALSVMIMPFMIIYFRNLGFSFFQIGLLTAAVSLGIFFFEVPTGAFADGWGRKESVILGFLMTAVCVTFIFFFSSFLPIFILWFLAGIGITFISGAEESWAIDNLNHYKRKDLHHEFFTKWWSISGFGFVFAPLIGAWLVNIHSIRILWVVFGIGFFLVAIVFSLFGEEYYKPKKIKLINALKETYSNSKKGFQFALKHKTVFLLILGTMFTAVMFIGDDGWQPFLVSLSLPTHALGFVYSILGLGMVVFPFISKLFVKKNLKITVSVTILIQMVFLLLIFLLLPPLFAIGGAIYVLLGGLKAIRSPLLDTYFHKFLPKNIRATVVSVKSLILSVTFAVIGLIGGALMDIFGPQKVIALGGLFGVLAIAAYLRIKD